MTMTYKYRRFVRRSPDGKHEDWITAIRHDNGNEVKHIADVTGYDKGSRIEVDMTTMPLRWAAIEYASNLREAIRIADTERAEMAMGVWKTDEA